MDVVNLQILVGPSMDINIGPDLLDPAGQVLNGKGLRLAVRGDAFKKLLSPDAECCLTLSDRTRVKALIEKSFSRGGRLWIAFRAPEKMPQNLEAK